MKKSQRSTETPDHKSGELRQTALTLLARREHSQQELERKLLSRGFPSQGIRSVLQELAQQDSLSDARFAEQYVYSRIQRGFGPLRIQAELRERGVDDEVFGGLIETNAEIWEERAGAARTKRFGPGPPGDFKERARQTRFLQQRGYTQEQIRSALDQSA